MVMDVALFCNYFGPWLSNFLYEGAEICPDSLIWTNFYNSIILASYRNLALIFVTSINVCTNAIHKTYFKEFELTQQSIFTECWVFNFQFRHEIYLGGYY